MQKSGIIILLLFVLHSANAAVKAGLKVDAGAYDRIDCVVSADLTRFGFTSGDEVELYEIVNGEKKKTPCQLSITRNHQTLLFWVLNGVTKAGISRNYVVETTHRPSNVQQAVMKVEDTGDALILRKEDKAVMQYNYRITYPPTGVSMAYRRSGYLHPVYSPSGNVLTNTQPKDHYHHYGIWNPWTRVEYAGKIYDLWNLGDKQGTVRAKTIANASQGDVFAGYDAKLSHYVFTPTAEKEIMDEWWCVKTWNVPEGFLWDFESELYPSTSIPLTIKAYRYAGFSYRATGEWTKENCEMMTSEGRDRKTIDGTNARWIYITGQCAEGRSGLLFLGHPDNYNYPEPLRIWDEKQNGGRGDAFINFAPTKNMDWKLSPGKQYSLKYRVFSYDGEMTKEKAERLWTDFAFPPLVTVHAGISN